MTATRRTALAARLLSIGRPVMAPMVGSVLARVVALGCGIGQLAVAVDGVVRVAQGEGRIGTTVAWLVGLSVVKAVARYLEQLAGHTVAFRALAILRVFFFDRLEPQAPAATDGRRTGDLLARATRDVDRIEVFFAHTLAPALTAVIVPVAVVGWLAVAVHPRVAVVAAIGLAVIGLVVPRWGDRSAADAARRLRIARGDVAQHVTDTVQGVREVLTFGHTEARLAGLREASSRIGGGVVAAGGWTARRRGLNAALAPATLVSVLLAAGPSVVDGELAWGQVVLALAVVLATTPTVLAVEDFAADLGQAFASAERVFEVTDAPPAVVDPVRPVDPPWTASGGPPPSLEVRGVRFRYPTRPDVVVLDGVDLVVPAGTTTALVGASGSGKSTLAGLALRFADPEAGSLRVGGVDLRNLRQSDLRRMVTLVQQRPYLFHDTIEANLRLARPDATRAEIELACARAALDEWIGTLPGGYATTVGEMGARLSGGQRQRLAIARALLRDAPVLVLDEVTSQLDVQTEAEVMAALAELQAGRTVLMIAHRLATVAGADQIVVLDAGRVVERGTHKALVASGGAYAALLARQRDDLDVEGQITREA